MLERYCEAVNIDTIEKDQCRKKNHFDFTNRFWGSLFEYMHGPWVEKRPSYLTGVNTKE
jgi:hypothetical protein